jgi:hypothetical protein
MNMSDKLPIIRGSRGINVSLNISTSLIGRGLSSILNKEIRIALTEKDARYRKARVIYNRITRYGDEQRFDADRCREQNEQVDLFNVNSLQPFYDMLKQLQGIFTVFQQLADEDYGKAYFPLAMMYRGGQGIKQNREKENHFSSMSFDWCFANQALNDPEIWTDLGALLSTDLGGMYDYKNEEKAIFWYRKAAEQGDADAQFRISQLCGIDPSKSDKIEKLLFCLKAAKQDHSEAQYHLGEIYSESLIVKKNDDQAAFWYRKAAEQNHVKAQRYLGFMYDFGRGVEQDDEKAVFWYRKAAEQGDSTAQCNLGVMYSGGWGIEKDDEQAVFWFRIAAEQGVADGQLSLDRIYAKGLGVKLENNSTLRLFYKAAKQCSSSAHANLGTIFYRQRSYEQGVFWYRKAAERGDGFAQGKLAWLYEKGLGVEQDDEQAVFWMQKTAEQGYGGAINLIGRGLCTIQNKKIGIPYTELDTRYRQARDIFNQLTDYGRNFQIEPYKTNHLQQLKKVFAVFQQLADLKYGKAYFPLAIFYCSQHSNKQDYDKFEYGRIGFDWCIANQKDSDPEIYLDLALMHDDEWGVISEGQTNEQYYQQRIFWYRKAAEHGYALAQFELACHYRYGHLDEDSGKYIHDLDEYCDCELWFLKAAEQEYVDAYSELGDWYEIAWSDVRDEHGNLYADEVDFEKAVFYYSKAAEQGDAFALKALKKLAIKRKNYNATRRTRT